MRGKPSKPTGTGELDGRQQAIDATAWFSVLMSARERNQFKEAAQAQRELGNLGVIVKFRRLPKPW